MIGATSTTSSPSDNAPRSIDISSSLTASARSWSRLSGLPRCTSTIARTSERDCSDARCGSSQSRPIASGYATGDSTTMHSLTTGAIAAAIRSFDGPVKSAAGMISPTKRTAVTEMRTAIVLGTSASRKIGIASFASELSTSSVTSSWWLGRCVISGSSMPAQRCSSGEPQRSLTRRSTSSSETTPIETGRQCGAQHACEREQQVGVVLRVVEVGEAPSASSSRRASPRSEANLGSVLRREERGVEVETQSSS